MIHHWLGWISLAASVLLLAKYIGRVSKCKGLNLALRRLHQPLGVAVIGVGAIHGILSCFKAPWKIVLNLTGLALLVLLLLLAGTFYGKARWRGKWFQAHRRLAVGFTAVAILHTALSVLRG